MRRIIFLFLLVALVSGCMPAPYYQKQEPIPQNSWRYDFKPVFKIDINDTSAFYQPYFIIQHSQAYEFCNLWLWMYIKKPGENTTYKHRVNLIMASPTGKWLGHGIGAIYEERIKLKMPEDFKFNKVGTYQVTLEQNMRVNPLPEILHIGFRLEKHKHEIPTEITGQ